jgi:hypothetical protein
MSTSVPTFRALAAVVAVLVGLTWGAPLAQAACVAAEHCGNSMPTEHCQWGESSPSSGCLMHFAEQEAVQTQTPSGNLPTTGGVSREGTRSISSPRVFVSRPSGDRRTFVRAEPRQAHVGVWLE